MEILDAVPEIAVLPDQNAGWDNARAAQGGQVGRAPVVAPSSVASTLAGPGFVLLSIGLAWACTTVIAVTFMVAAMAPDNQVVVKVNDYGEMAVETVAVGAVWVTVTVSFTVLWWKFWNRP